LTTGSKSEIPPSIFARYVLGEFFLSGKRCAISAAERRARAAFAGLVAVELATLRSYFHLERSARLLFERAHRRRRRSGGSAIRQVEFERTRLGRELHTGVGQMLAAIGLQLEIVQKLLPTPEPQVAQALDRISLLSSQALGQVRSVSSRLHPPEWQRLTLEEALRHLWEISGIAQFFEGELRIESPAEEPELDVKILIYRSLQEVLSNLVRHARASRIDVSLQQRDNFLVLIARDNGVGFTPAGSFSPAGAVNSGIGLRAIREQTEEMGGKLVVNSGPTGTKLEIRVPFGPLAL
jgi:two-component system, NarL family, sensor kinase